MSNWLIAYSLIFASMLGVYAVGKMKRKTRLKNMSLEGLIAEKEASKKRLESSRGDNRENVGSQKMAPSYQKGRASSRSSYSSVTSTDTSYYGSSSGDSSTSDCSSTSSASDCSVAAGE